MRSRLKVRRQENDPQLFWKSIHSFGHLSYKNAKCSLVPAFFVIYDNKLHTFTS